jgi:hypothetical protein
MKKDILKEKTLDFAVRIVHLKLYLSDKKQEYTSIKVDAEEIMRISRSVILTKKQNLALKTLSLLAIITLIVIIYHSSFLTHNS